MTPAGCAFDQSNKPGLFLFTFIALRLMVQGPDGQVKRPPRFDDLQNCLKSEVKTRVIAAGGETSAETIST
jgi:hypothetical protein